MLKTMWAGLVRQVRLLTILTVAAVAAGTGWSYLSDVGDSEADSVPAQAGTASSNGEPAWGSEVLEDIHRHVLAGMPIRVANACGLGASSCFRCHNGKRAEAPGSDPDKDPWHVHHKKVNYSCAGCHQGNPRLMKQDIAHRGLIANPLTQPEKTCFSCHTSGDGQTLVDRYQKLSNTTGEQ